jgi:hypothetical protein
MAKRICGAEIMRSAQFVKGKIWSEEKQDSFEQTFESRCLETFLPYEKLARLRSQKNITAEPIQRYSQDNHVLSLSVVKEADRPDKSGRTGLIIHCFLVELPHTLTQDGLSYKLDNEAFVEDLLASKWRLKMPPYPELKKPLETPIVEWEVHP